MANDSWWYVIRQNKTTHIDIESYIYIYMYIYNMHMLYIYIYIYIDNNYTNDKCMIHDIQQLFPTNMCSIRRRSFGVMAMTCNWNMLKVTNSPNDLMVRSTTSPCLLRSLTRCPGQLNRKTAMPTALCCLSLFTMPLAQENDRRPWPLLRIRLYQ